MKASRLSVMVITFALAVLAVLVGCGEDNTNDDGNVSTVPKLYIADEESGTLSVLDTTTFQRMKSVDLTERGQMFMPHNVQVAPDGKSVWATAIPMEGHGDKSQEQVVVVDPHKDTVIKRIAVGNDIHLAHIVLDTDSRFTYVSANEANQVLRIDAGTKMVVGRYELGVGRKPHGMRYAAGKLYVANMDGKSLSIIDTNNGSIKEILLGGIAVQTAVTPDGRYAFVSLYDTREVIRYDIGSGEVRRISLPNDSHGPIQIYPTPDSKRLYVADQGNLMGRPSSNKLYEVDVEGLSVTRTMEVGKGAHGVVVSPDGKAAYVTNTVDNTVSVINLETWEVLSTVRVGESPNGVSHWSITGGTP